MVSKHLRLNRYLVLVHDRLVEHFSPYCSHCKAFEPTWTALVSNHTAGASLAQVDCIVNGGTASLFFFALHTDMIEDLCNKNGIKAYPTINLYKDGKFVETYSQSRDLDKLQAYVDLHAVKRTIQEPVTPAKLAAKPVPEPPSRPVNVPGQVEKLSETTFKQFTSQPEPILVKFFAPWCGHCKKLAPIYAKLAGHLKGRVQIAEVDCDRYPKVCKAQDIRGYPTLKWYSGSGSEGVEYTGKRTGDAMRAFINKATQSPITPLEKDVEIDALMKTNDVTYLLLHATDDTVPLVRLSFPMS